MKITICDCCRGQHDVERTLMDAEGIHELAPTQRQNGFMLRLTVDLCEGCRVALALKWGELSKGGTDGK